jgi:hypothetical protein
MKKVLALILIVVSILMLSGCKGEVKKTPMGWALERTKEVYNEDYEGYGIFGYHILEGIIDKSELDMLEENQSAKMYLITIVDESGRGRLYNTLIVYEQSAFDMYFGARYIKESQIVDVDIEVALYD